jgi:ATP-dependent DNA ligase
LLIPFDIPKKNNMADPETTKLRKFPKLYKTTKTGKVVWWQITLEKINAGVKMSVQRGYTDGKTVDEVPQTIENGKAGRSVVEQANLDAQSKHNKKLHEGYETAKQGKSQVKNQGKDKEHVESPEPEEAQEDSSGESNGKSNAGCHKVYPYLLKDFASFSKKIKYPASVQIKFDGIRSITGYQCDDPKKLIMTSRKAIPLSNQMEHIKNEILDAGLLSTLGNVYLDGELYTKDMTFEELSGLIRKKYLDDDDYENTKKIKYHIFDFFDPDNKSLIYSERRELLEKAFEKTKDKMQYTVLVGEYFVKSEEEVRKKLEQFMKDGYEGVVIRNLNFLYPGTNVRLSDVQKLKKFQDSEFKIVGANKGTGRYASAIIFELETKEKKRFNAVYKGSMEEREKLYKIRNSLIGLMATVVYQELTAMGVPRFGIVKTIRNLGDFL